MDHRPGRTSQPQRQAPSKADQRGARERARGPAKPFEGEARVEAELVELGGARPPTTGTRLPAIVGGAALVLALLLAVAGVPPFDRGGADPLPGATPGPSVRGAPNGAATRPPPSAHPGAWQAISIPGYGRGATVENLWVVGSRFVAEVETDEGPDGGPYGPLSSVILVSDDGLSWRDLDLPIDDLALEAGTVTDGRLWLVGHTGMGEAAHRQLWSTDALGWRHEGDPVGLAEGGGTVRKLAYRSGCEGDGDCSGVGWVAVTARLNSHRDELRVSTDGLTWAPVAADPDRSMSVIGIAFHAGRWVVAATRFTDRPSDGELAALASTNRVEWVLGELASAVVDRGATAGRALAASETGLALVGLEGTADRRLPVAWHNPPGGGWLLRRPTMAPGRDPASMDHVVGAAAGFLAISTSTGDGWRSADGESWRGFHAFVAGESDTVRALAVSGDVAVAAGRSGAGRPTFWVGSLGAQRLPG